MVAKRRFFTHFAGTGLCVFLKTGPFPPVMPFGYENYAIPAVYSRRGKCYDSHIPEKAAKNMRERLRRAFKLYLYFFRIGWFTFGGGWSIVAQMQTDFVEKEQSIDDQELLDIVSVGKSLPGTMIGNVAYLFGYHQCGIPGGVMAVLGIITPPLILLSILTFFYRSFRDNVYVARALTGVRAVVAPVIFSAVWKLQKAGSSLPKQAFYGLCALGCVLSFVFRLGSVLVVLLGVALGVGYHFLLKRKEGAAA